MVKIYPLDKLQKILLLYKLELEAYCVTNYKKKPF